MTVHEQRSELDGLSPAFVRTPRNRGHNSHCH